MTSSSYVLDRDCPGSARNIIDAHSNVQFSQQIQHNTYRSSYGTTSPLPFTTNSTTSYHHHGYGNNCNENHEPKQIIADVRFDLINNQKFQKMNEYLVTRSNSFIEKRFRKKRCSYSRIKFYQVIFLVLLNLFYSIFYIENQIKILILTQQNMKLLLDKNEIN